MVGGDSLFCQHMKSCARMSRDEVKDEMLPFKSRSEGRVVQ